MRAVLCLAGGMASGKSTLAHELAEHLPGSTVLAFGDVVRRRAAQEGHDQDRATLQAIGMQLVAEGWPTFINLLLAGHDPVASGVLIIEGIRHLEAVEEIRRRFQAVPVRVVFIQLDASTTERRLRQRDGRADGQDHAVEADVWRLAQAADLVLDGAQPIEESIAAVGRILAGNTFDQVRQRPGN